MAAAKTDGSPLLFLTGEVGTAVEGLGMLQDASSQTLDDVDVMKPVTCYSSSGKMVALGRPRASTAPGRSGTQLNPWRTIQARPGFDPAFVTTMNTFRNGLTIIKPD